jgi:hypothetical protein
MLIRNKGNAVYRSRVALRMPGPRAAAAAAAPFPGLYMRPNGGSDGSVPAQAPYSVCPDIWIAGKDAIAPGTLITPESYAGSSQNNVRSGMQNLIYIRGRNGSSSSKTCTVKLYYAPSAIIQSPSDWQHNRIITDKGARHGTITAEGGAVAVCDSTFNWLSPEPPAGSDHYCLLAQFNDAQNSNPFPNPENVFDLAALVTNDLGWGWRNVSMIDATPTWSLSEPLTIPANWPPSPAPGEWQIQIRPTGFLNWDVELECSELDSRGVEIVFPRTKITTPGTGFLIPGLTLDPGWSASVSVSLYSPDGSLPQSGWAVHIEPINIQTSPAARREAVHRNLVDAGFMAQMRACYPEVYSGPELALVPGGYQGMVPSPNPGDSRA